MEFIANKLNGNFLRNILPNSSDEITEAMAAIAYGSNFQEDLISNCVKNKYRLDIWMRYDHTVPVEPSLLKRILSHHKDNIFCSLIPDRFHSKVIWWKGYGVYIGSANHTDNGWISNIEAGVFLTEFDLQRDNMERQLEDFFDSLSSLDVCQRLSPQIIEELEKIQALRKGADSRGEELRSIPEWNGPTFVKQNNFFEKRKINFQNEWRETLGYLHGIGELLKEHRPSWVSKDVPIEWQIDQFLHAYYYNKVGESLQKPYEDYYKNNCPNPSRAVNEAISWWERTLSAPSHEDVTLYINAPLIKDYLSKDKILSLTENEFSAVCFATHATKDHVIKMDLTTLGRPDLRSLSRDERVPLFARWLLKQKNGKGLGVLELLQFVLYGGDDGDLWHRLYLSFSDQNYKLPHYGLNSIAELVGWARPELSPPRNGRTSKALRALGFDVKIY